MSTNPYEPPRSKIEARQESPQWEEQQLWRAGQLLVVGENALLPSLCFKTGLPTVDYYRLKTTQRPDWLYWLLLLGILPYFIALLWHERNIELQIPLNRQLATTLKRWDQVRIAYLTFSVVVTPVALWFGVRLVIITFVFAMIAFCINRLFAKSRLDIQVVPVDKDHISLTGVHQSILNSLPSFKPSKLDK